ncbi:kinase-like domain-containing protein [Podospora appendiculata]|uniref:Kinase-like domain-containing protein n=1 Tax=Podospora appendiculata TaxID=314037 RepID=A0AAE0WYQ5_9PEZI|nr:kinase-like domain-containing protein [Podospora appendiculata]
MKICDERLPLSKSDMKDVLKQAKGISEVTGRFFEHTFCMNQSEFCLPKFTRRIFPAMQRGENIATDFPHENIPIHIIKKLGRGGFGFVYKIAIHPDHHEFGQEQFYAMKVFDKSHDTDASFARENHFFGTRAAVEHGGIVTPLAFWTHRNTGYMILPCADHDLETHLETRAIGSLSDFCAVLKQLHTLISGLAKIHYPTTTDSNFHKPSENLQPKPVAQTGYHMDIKPENILVFVKDGEDGKKTEEFRLTDFGCGRIAAMTGNSRGQVTSHQTRNMMGNHTYQAPEALETTPLSSRPSDIWSMGALLLEVLVWMLHGWDALKQFRSKINGVVSTALNTESGRFYLVENDKRPRLRDAVLDKMASTRNEKACKGPVAALLTTIERMLAVDKETRPNAMQVFQALQSLQFAKESDFEPADFEGLFSQASQRPGMKEMSRLEEGTKPEEEEKTVKILEDREIPIIRLALVDEEPAIQLTCTSSS